MNNNNRILHSSQVNFKITRSQVCVTWGGFDLTSSLANNWKLFIFIASINAPQID